MCRFWLSDEHGYQRLLHFFRPKAFSIAALWQTWQGFVLTQRLAVEVAGRCVLLGDHTHVVKDGGRMPGVVSLRKTLETQSKPSYFRGQCWATPLSYQLTHYTQKRGADSAALLLSPPLPAHGSTSSR